MKFLKNLEQNLIKISNLDFFAINLKIVKLCGGPVSMFGEH